LKHIKVLNDSTFTCDKKGCGECQTSCQSAIKTGIAVPFQMCEKVQMYEKCEKKIETPTENIAK